MRFSFRNDAARRGLTLMELIVVLSVLIALAAIVVPLLPSMLSRSHDASAATNISEISRAVQTYNSLYWGYPNNLDNLIESTTGNTLLGTLAGGGNLAGMVTPYKLTQTDVTALQNSGILTVANLTGAAPTTGNATTLWSPTFFPYTTVPATTTTLAVGTSVAALTGTQGFTAGTTPAAPAAGTGMFVGVGQMGLSPTGNYIVLGFGVANTAVGKTVQECPVHFPDTQTINPTTYYERYGLVFYTSDNNPNISPTNAVLVGVVCLLDDGIETAGMHIQDYFQRGVSGN